jgi:cysteine desulfurase/selenocysteine lyase
MTIAADKIAPYDVERIRADFPILARSVRGRPLVYLDNAASAQKPRAVSEAERTFVESDYANIHRGVHRLSQQASERYEAARGVVRGFLNARHAHEIIFTRGTTESINLVAASFVRRFLKPGDEVILSQLEHHSNIVPWQMLRETCGIVLKIAPIDDNGDLKLDSVTRLLGPRTRLVALAHVSNVLGTVLPVAEIIRCAHAVGAKVLLDGAQAVAHLPVDVQALDCDFYAFSGHKLYGPTGIGVLYGKEALLDAMPPTQGGGGMIASVSFEHSTWAPLPAKFEAGTPAIVQAAGLAAAIDYLGTIGHQRIARHEQSLLAYAIGRLSDIRGLRLVGTAPGKVGVLSFALDSAHPHDVAQILDGAGVAVRAGHHCAQPLMERLGLAATVRASFGLYNTRAEVDTMVEALARVEEMFARCQAN